ncbi:cysteine protease StiP family protein [Micromonospora sp. NPDC005299]|uniref:cysteine protease StiP family protein n=1 Tax=Micromonospora sp. NPDC005299 TaxID=3364231 RepID=UPI0036B20ABC
MSAPTPGLPKPLHGPSFGSYDRDEVAWLLTDLSRAELEATTEEREDAVQSGRAHYAASLPVEYQPSAEYQQLFQDELASSASQLARAVGVVMELVLAARGENVVLVSLARAGTPVGVLMRRWARFAHRLDVPHYSCSIVRARGIDMVALEYLAAHHRPSDIMFVDGWTGKGAITRELADAVAKANVKLGLPEGERFAPDLAVLADTGRCVEIYGTREDCLVPSACLNSTVSGLVSRTVLNDDLIGPGQFHGAKFYSHLAGVDVSGQFLDAVTAKFPNVADAVARDWPATRSADRSPTWAGWRVAQAISREYGIGDINLVKPGVGETTRVLLRRVPWKILIRPDAARDLRHIRMLAEQRGVGIEIVDNLPYRCVGLIQPRRRTNAPTVEGGAGEYEAAGRRTCRQ